MPGTNHRRENGFLENLSIGQREAAENLLRHQTLRNLLVMDKQGVDEFEQQNFPFIKDHEWQEVIKRVILIKISYFEANESFELAEIDFLIKVAKITLEMPNASITELYNYIESRYPVFARTIRDFLVIRQVKVKKLAKN